MNEFWALVIGSGLRLAVPALITVLVVYGLRRLDERWQREAQATPPVRPVVLPLTPPEPPCWEVHGCTAAQQAQCAAAHDPTQPCWQHFRDAQGNLRPACLDCAVFDHARPPAPQVVTFF